MHHGRARDVGQHDRPVDGRHLDVAFDALDEDLVAVDGAELQIRSGRDLKLHIGSAAQTKPADGHHVVLFRDGEPGGLTQAPEAGPFARGLVAGITDPPVFARDDHIPSSRGAHGDATLEQGHVDRPGTGWIAERHGQPIRI